MASLDPAIVPHVQHIRDALWRDGAATVMVGAGFSLNAEPLIPGARPFPLWDELAHEMAKRIGLNDGKPRDPLRLAQMYASTRGRMELDRLIERTLPDGEWRPGELHRRLLELTEALHLRAWASALASALAKALNARGLAMPVVLVRWRELCANDPLPEVRTAWAARSR